MPVAKRICSRRIGGEGRRASDFVAFSTGVYFAIVGIVVRKTKKNKWASVPISSKSTISKVINFMW